VWCWCINYLKYRVTQFHPNGLLVGSSSSLGGIYTLPGSHRSHSWHSLHWGMGPWYVAVSQYRQGQRPWWNFCSCVRTYCQCNSSLNYQTLQSVYTVGSATHCLEKLPIPKKQGAKGPNDFRPISLLPILSKILEKHFPFLFLTTLVSTPHCQLVSGDSNQLNPLSLLYCPLIMTGSSSLRRERKLEPFSLTIIRHLTLPLTSYYLLNFVNVGSTHTLSSGFIII